MVSPIQKVLNFGKAVVKHAGDGFRPTTPAELRARLEQCNQCEQNLRGVCAECGCFILLKARWNSEDCPKGKWPKI